MVRTRRERLEPHPSLRASHLPPPHHLPPPATGGHRKDGGVEEGRMAVGMQWESEIERGRERGFNSPAAANGEAHGAGTTKSEPGARMKGESRCSAKSGKDDWGEGGQNGRWEKGFCGPLRRSRPADHPPEVSISPADRCGLSAKHVQVKERLFLSHAICTSALASRASADRSLHPLPQRRWHGRLVFQSRGISNIFLAPSKHFDICFSRFPGPSARE